MADCEDNSLIKITHYINPHMFWYKYETSFLTNDKLFQLENNLQQHFFKLQNKPSVKEYSPNVEEIVAVYCFSYNRWIRARCDHIIEYTIKDPKYVLWAIDYGIPFQTESKWIRRLPEEFLNNEANSVFFGGLGNVVPSEKVFNFEKFQAEIIPSKSWSPLAVRTMENLINFAATIKFFPNKKTKEGQYFGDLEVQTYTNQTIKADLVLLEINQAMLTSNFFNDIRQIGTNKLPRWQTNDGNSFVSKFNVNKMSTEKIKYDEVPRRKMQDNCEATREDIDLEIERKVSDWEERNQVSRQKTETSIDDISFNDSVSVAMPSSATKPNQMQLEEEVDNEFDEQYYKVAGTSRKKRLERYSKNLPRPPRDSTSSTTSKEEVTLSSPQKPVSDVTSMVEVTLSPPKQTSENGHKSDISQKDKSNETTALSNSKTVHRLPNRQKLIQAALSASKPKNVENQLPQHAMPAGFDLRNLKPTKESIKEVKDNQNNIKMNGKNNNQKAEIRNKRQPTSFQNTEEVW